MNTYSRRTSYFDRCKTHDRPWAVCKRTADIVEDCVKVAGEDAFQADVPLRGFDAAVAEGLVENRHLIFGGVMVFIALLVLGFIYDWRKGVFKWR